MKVDEAKLELFIDIFGKKNQRAFAEPGLSVAELVGAILEEFRELEFLTNNAADYILLRAEKRSPLEEALTLNQQVPDRARLILAEREWPVPSGTQHPTQHIYLRDEASGYVYPIRWYPAIIGRPDPALAHNDWIAVNMTNHSQGQSVSRRHAEISEEKGVYYIRSLSPNKTTIRHELGTNTMEGSDKYIMKHGDVIYFDLSQISLKFIIRDDEETAL